MPLFGKKKKSDANSSELSPTHNPTNLDNDKLQKNDSLSSITKTTSVKNGEEVQKPATDDQMRKPKYNFHCQLAHGSPTGIIFGFTNVVELYGKIAQCFDIDPREIIFCTLNTHKIDTEKLLGAQIGLDDFIFAHVKGQKKEIELTKTAEALGLTITDNGAGYAFIKRIKEGSIVDNTKLIEVGDHIEKIDNVSFVNKRHFDVAKQLKDIPQGSTFILRLISPEKSAYANLNPRTGAKGTGSSMTNGKKTLRLRAKGEVTEEEAPNAIEDGAIAAINRLIEGLLGIDDQEMAHTIWELGKDLDNPHNFAVAVDQAMGDFDFPDDLVFDFWGAILDAKSGRLSAHKNATAEAVEFSEDF